jgi:hypothetical protein
MAKRKDSKIKKRPSNIKILIYDIFPPENLKKVSKRILGIRTYPNRMAKIIALSWRFVFALFLIFCLLTGFAPIKFLQSSIINAIKGVELKTVNFYPKLFYIDPPPDNEISQLNSGLGWENIRNIQGPPEVEALGDISSFTKGNSAVYRAGDFSLICGEFDIEEPAGEEISVEGGENLLEDESLINTEGKATSSDILNVTSTISTSTATSTNSTFTESADSETASSTIPSLTPALIAASTTNSTNTSSTSTAVDSITERSTSTLNSDDSNFSTPTDDRNLNDFLGENQKIENNTEETPEPESSITDDIGETGEIKEDSLPNGDNENPEIIEAENDGLSSDALDAASGSEENEKAVDGDKTIGFLKKVNFIRKSISETVKKVFDFEALAQVEYRKFKSAKINLSLAVGEEDLISVKDEGEQNQSTTSGSGIENTTNTLNMMEGEVLTEVTDGKESSTSTIEDKPVNFLEDKSDKSSTGSTDYLPNSEMKIIIWYSLDGQLWGQLGMINEKILSNALNKGYFSYDAPFLKDWQDINNLKIKFEGKISNESQFTAFLDSVWIEAQYYQREEDEEEKAEYILELISNKNNFKFNEEPIFKFRYQKKKNFIESLTDDIFNLFEDEYKGINIKAVVEGLDITPNIRYQKNGEFLIDLPNPPRQFRPGKYKLKV